jgi:thiamine kinase-like enzyme
MTEQDTARPESLIAKEMSKAFTPPEASVPSELEAQVDAHVEKIRAWREDEQGDWALLCDAESLIREMADALATLRAEQDALQPTLRLLRKACDDWKALTKQAEAERDAARQEVARLRVAVEQAQRDVMNLPHAYMGELNIDERKSYKWGHKDARHAAAERLAAALSRPEGEG